MRIPPLAALAALFLCSCGGEEGRAFTLLTTKPEVADYAAAYNAGRSSGLAIVSFATEAQLPKALAMGQFDVVVAPRLLSLTEGSGFIGLDGLLTEGAAKRDSFYLQILPAGLSGGAQKFLPLSFNLPLAFFKDGAFASEDSFLIELIAMRSISEAFNAKKGASFTNMGFSPRWDQSFLPLATELLGSAFSQATPLTWNSEGLGKAYSFLRAWSVESNGGIATEDDFNFKYLYDPKDKLVLDGRILFATMDSEAYFALGKEKREQLDFRWLANEGRALVSEDILMLGVREGAAARKAAEGFALWLLDPATQESMLKRLKARGDSSWSFGFAGGFSALRKVTELSFPLYYPELIGRMPPPSSLSLHRRLPANWPALEEKVIAPFLNEGIAGGDMIEDKKLAERIATWIKQNP